VALVLAATTLAAAGRWVWAGVAAGLAVATKQHGLLFLPLVAATGWLVAQRRARARALVRMGLGCLVVVLGLTVWDALRWRVRASFWEQSAVSHGPLHLINWWQLGERLADWSKLLGYVLASPLLNVVLLLGVPLLLWRSRRAMLAASSEALAARADWLLAGFSALFFLAHWLLSFNVWDRYLLGLAPLAALLLARIVWQGAARLGLKRIGLAGLAVAVLLAGPAAKAGQAGYPIGGDHGAYQGLEQVIAFFRQAPAGAVVWHRYLGWHYFYYLSGAPLTFKCYAEPAILAAQAPPEIERQQYVVFPAWKEKAEKETRATLAAVGLDLRTERRVWRPDGSLAFTIYRIVTTDTPSGRTWRLEQ